MARISLAQTGYVGIPYLLFLENVDYGRGTQTHLEKMIKLEKMYAYLRGELPVMYEEKKKLDEYDTTIKPLLFELNGQIEIMNQCYEATFEGIDHCNPAEKDFIKIMRGVYERIVVLECKSKILAQERGTDEAVFMG
jgi:hypothetical protein